VATERYSTVPRPRLNHPKLWLWAVLTFGVGDVLSTWYFLQRPGNVESNPVALGILNEFGYFGLVAWKAVVFGLFAGLYRVTPREVRVGVPIGLAVFGTLIIAWNTVSSLLGIKLMSLF